MILSLDIETVRHPGVPPKDDEEGCPAAPHHQIVAAAGVVLMPQPAKVPYPEDYDATRLVTFGGNGAPNERAIVCHLSEALYNKPRLVTYNGDGFDLRVIVAAAMEHGIHVPWLFAKEVTYRYGTDGHEDVMDTLTQYGAGRRARQDAWARRIGLPGKMGVDGGDVAALVQSGEFEALRAYNAQDAWQLAGIWLRKELVARRLTLTGYQASARSLVALAEEEMALQPILEHERFDGRRFLLEGAC